MPNSVPMSECTLNSGAISRPASARERGRERMNEAAMASAHVDAHQARGIRVLHHGEQRLAEPGAVEGELQRKRDADARRPG